MEEKNLNQKFYNVKIQCQNFKIPKYQNCKKNLISKIEKSFKLIFFRK